jgi:ABC-type transporter Mla subunit MlaD
MPDDVKTAIDQLANSLQTVTLLSTQLRRDLGESAQRAVELEAAADKAVNTIKRLQPRKKYIGSVPPLSKAALNLTGTLPSLKPPIFVDHDTRGCYKGTNLPTERSEA